MMDFKLFYDQNLKIWSGTITEKSVLVTQSMHPNLWFFLVVFVIMVRNFSIRIFPSASAIRHPQVSGPRSTDTLCSVLLFFHVVSGMQLNIAWMKFTTFVFSCLFTALLFSLKKWAYLKYERVLLYSNDRLAGFSSTSLSFFFLMQSCKLLYYSY